MGEMAEKIAVSLAEAKLGSPGTPGSPTTSAAHDEFWGQIDFWSAATGTPYSHNELVELSKESLKSDRSILTFVGRILL